MSSKAPILRPLAAWKLITRNPPRQPYRIQCLSTSSYRQPLPPPPRLPPGVKYEAVITCRLYLQFHILSCSGRLMPFHHSSQENQNLPPTPFNPRQMPRASRNLHRPATGNPRSSLFPDASLLQGESRFCQSRRYPACALQVR